MSEIQEAQRRGVIAGGNWIIDHVKVVDAWPAQDALATIVSQSDANGGGPFNLLEDLARLKAPFPLDGVGSIGADADGERILADCDAHGIGRSGFHQTKSAPTSYTDVMTAADSGRRTFFHCHGANALLGNEHFALGMSGARVFYLGYLCLLPRLDVLSPDGKTGAAELFEEARQLGMVNVTDLVSTPREDFSAVVTASLPHVDYLFLNELELTRLAGCSVEPAGANALEAAARQVLMRGVRRAVVVHRPDVALWVGHNGRQVLQPAVRVPRDMVRGSVGAGDAFAAGVVMGIHEQWTPERCLELGVCAAATSLLDATSSVAVKPWEESLAFGRELGFHSVPTQ